MNVIKIHRHIPIPDWLIEAIYCEVNLGCITDSKLNEWADQVIAPIGKLLAENDELYICANHVHIGDAGVAPHDHLPHAYTSVLFLTDAIGKLVIHTSDGDMYIEPEEGMLVLFPADLIHHVEHSPYPEMRISFVSNYELPNLS